MTDPLAIPYDWLAEVRSLGPAALPAASGKGRLITLWILSSLVALTFLAAGGGKLAGTAVMIEMPS